MWSSRWAIGCPTVMLAGQHRQPRADVGEDRLAAARGLLQIDVELAVVNAFGVLIELGAARAPSDGADLRHLGDDLLGEAPDAIGFGEADARLQDDADEHRPLVERRQEGARQQQAAGKGGGDGDGRQADDEARPVEAPFEARLLPALQQCARGRCRARRDCACAAAANS